MTLGAQRVRNPCSRPSIFPTWGRAAQVDSRGRPALESPILSAAVRVRGLPPGPSTGVLGGVSPLGPLRQLRSGSAGRAGTPLARLSRPEGGSRFGVAQSLGRRRSPTAAGTHAHRIFEVPGVRGPPGHPLSSDCDKQDRLWQWI
ncbi:hypothetical protein NDU88_005891 [Pleurodeles waltl]|uniref:Uncharacterized protein n=1 Tax=Pleurodeles waltl TaxID=8319 RepID=A0AAV7NST9_PLEWA|nr:hypothetical protein NDU88_005891 [Pleurodeles waltl]